MKKYSIYLLLLSFWFSNAQDVNDIIEKSVKFYDTQVSYKLEVSYKMFYTHDAKTPNEQIAGIAIKRNDDVFVKQAKTSQIYNKSKDYVLKVFDNEKIIKVTPISKSQSLPDQVAIIKDFIKYFKDKTVKDLGSYYLCTLSSGAVTPIPYGKVELYINKKDYSIQKQVMYMLSQHTFKNEKGEQQVGNPRMEVELKSYTNKLSQQDIAAIDLTTYMNKRGKTFEASNDYKGYKIYVQ